MKSKKRFQANRYANKDMNADTYALRRQVMSFIYEAKKLDPTLPRIDVRITENHREALGSARLSDNIIWISERAVKDKQFDLRTIVFHEIVHAVYGVGHDESCILMKATHTPLTKEQVYKSFTHYIPKNKLAI